MISKPVPSSCCAGDFTTCADEANEPWFPGIETNYLYNEVGFTRINFPTCIHLNLPLTGKINRKILLPYYAVVYIALFCNNVHVFVTGLFEQPPEPTDKQPLHLKRDGLRHRFDTG